MSETTTYRVYIIETIDLSRCPSTSAAFVGPLNDRFYWRAPHLNVSCANEYWEIDYGNHGGQAKCSGSYDNKTDMCALRGMRLLKLESADAIASALATIGEYVSVTISSLEGVQLQCPEQIRAATKSSDTSRAIVRHEDPKTVHAQLPISTVASSS